MKITFIALMLVGLLWLAGLIFKREIVSAHMLDAVLPPSVLSKTTAEERRQITDALRGLAAPSAFSWIGAVAVVALSGLALKKSQLVSESGKWK